MFVLALIITIVISSLITAAVLDSRQSRRTPSLTRAKHTIDELRINTMWEIGELSERCISRMSDSANGYR